MTSYAEYLSQGIAIGTGVVGLLSAVGTAYVASRHLWRRTVGRRRQQQRLIETLACGSSREFVQSVFGVPQFRSATADVDTICYSTGGSWVVVEFKSDVVVAFSITVTNPRLYVSTDRLCFDQLKVRLGRSTFQDAPVRSLGEKLWTGARRYGYLRHYYFGNPAGYQNYWLSYNMCGSGSRTGVSTDPYDVGSYGERGVRDEGIDTITINTLTVAGPAFTDVATYLERDVLGPENDMVRLALTPQYPPH